MQHQLTIAGALAQARERVDTIDARILLQHVLGVERTYLVTHANAVLAAEQWRRYVTLVARRAGGEPVAYLTGKREFYGLRFNVTADVLIPRPETELVVDIVLAKLAARPQPRVLDLGTGSGAIAIALAALRADATVIAVDASEPALAIARFNAQALLGHAAAHMAFRQSNWYDTLGAERFDAIVSNPPYVAAGDKHLAQGDLRYEPQQALVGGDDGLDAIREIVSGAAQHLNPGGWLIIEHGYDQAERCRNLFASAGFSAIQSARDLAQIERVTFAPYNQLASALP